MGVHSSIVQYPLIRPLKLQFQQLDVNYTQIASQLADPMGNSQIIAQTRGYFGKKMVLQGQIYQFDLENNIILLTLEDDVPRLYIKINYQLSSLDEYTLQNLIGITIIFICQISQVDIDQEGQLKIVADFLFNDNYIQYNESIYLTYLLQQLQSANSIQKCSIDEIYLELTEITYMDIIIDNCIHNTIDDKAIRDLIVNKLSIITFDMLFVSIMKTTLTLQSPFNGQLFQMVFSDEYYLMNLKKQLKFRDKMIIKTYIKKMSYQMLGSNKTLIIYLEQTRNIKIISDKYESNIQTYSYTTYKKQYAVNKQNYIILDGKTEFEYIKQLISCRDKQLNQYLSLLKIQYEEDFNANIQLYHNKFLLELLSRENIKNANKKEQSPPESPLESENLLHKLRNNTVEDDIFV